MTKMKAGTIAMVTVLLLGTFAAAQNTQTGAFAEEIGEARIHLTTTPEKPLTGEETTLTFTVFDAESGARISHVDWSVSISYNGNELYKSQTLHSHAGVMPIGVSFPSEGSYDVSVRVASLGPKMLGMDVPPMARTHIMKSDGTPMGWANDLEFDFGTRTTEFSVAVQASGKSVTVEGTNTPTPIGETVTIEGTVPDTKVTIDFSADSSEIIAGEPTTLKFAFTDPEGKPVIHTDAELKIASGEYVASRTGGSMGVLHGHTGEIAVTATFDNPGRYVASITGKSIKMGDMQISSYHWGKADASFVIDVKNQADRGQTTSDADNTLSIGQQNTFIVEITSQDAPYYTPHELVVPKGSKIQFVNTDAIMHTATSTISDADEVSPDADGRFDTGLLASGQSVVIELNEEGEYNYFCQVHPWMKGKIVVTSA